MRDDICTIPISEVFEVQDGCPICRMYKTIEDHILDYTLGAAMMEPDVRIETNKKGFCTDHYMKMLGRRNRLQLALILESHIKSVAGEVFAGTLFNTDAKKAKTAKGFTDSCFMCEKIERGMKQMTETIYRTYEKESDFRNMFNSQPQFCLPHYEMLLSGADKKKMPHYNRDFCKNLTEITLNYAKELSGDVSHFCKMFDYRSNNEDWGNSKDAVERTIGYLSGRKID